MNTIIFYVFCVLFLFATTTMHQSALVCCAETEPNIPSVLSSDFVDYSENSENNEVPLAEIDPMLDNQLEHLSNVLMSVLRHSWGPSGVPIVYLENPTSTATGDGEQEDDAGFDDNPIAFTGPTLKRSRYYRSRYEVDNRYMCQPTREDVFKLLVALHETRAGNGGKSIHFCNRRRSAGAIFTNIRFLGRK